MVSFDFLPADGVLRLGDDWLLVVTDCLFFFSCGVWRSVIGGSLVSRGYISVGDLTSLMMYTVYVGSGMQMLTYVFSHTTTHLHVGSDLVFVDLSS